MQQHDKPVSCTLAEAEKGGAGLGATECDYALKVGKCDGLLCMRNFFGWHVLAGCGWRLNVGHPLGMLWQQDFLASEFVAES